MGVQNVTFGSILTLIKVIFIDKLKTDWWSNCNIKNHNFLIDVIPLIFASITFPNGLPSRSTLRIKRG